jgi:hypothetical protein
LFVPLSSPLPVSVSFFVLPLSLPLLQPFDKRREDQNDDKLSECLFSWIDQKRNKRGSNEEKRERRKGVKGKEKEDDERISLLFGGLALSFVQHILEEIDGNNVHDISVQGHVDIVVSTLRQRNRESRDPRESPNRVMDGSWSDVDVGSEVVDVKQSDGTVGSKHGGIVRGEMIVPRKESSSVDVFLSSFGVEDSENQKIDGSGAVE